MSSVTKIRTMLQRLGFGEAAATYLMDTCGSDALDEITYLGGIDDVGTKIKGVTSPRGAITPGTGSAVVTSCSNIIPLSIRDVANLKLCVYYLKHMERVKRNPVANSNNLILVRSYQDQQHHDVSLKKTSEEPVINDKDWHITL
jgi:hypothetical protein